MSAFQIILWAAPAAVCIGLLLNAFVEEVVENVGNWLSW